MKNQFRRVSEKWVELASSFKLQQMMLVEEASGDLLERIFVERRIRNAY